MRIIILCLVLTVSTLRGSSTEDAFSRESILEAYRDIQSYIVKTPLIYLPTLSQRVGKEVYLKDESQQKGYSFKTRGVTYEVFKTIEQALKEDSHALKKGLKLVTQTDGNHGIALILAVTSAIEKFSKEFPARKDDILKIEPVIFTYKNILPIKRGAMEEALHQYRNLVGVSNQGQIHDSYSDYGDAKSGREEFIKEQEGKGIYMEHGGIKTMQGHASASIEILDQLKEYGLSDQDSICLFLPIGAGGPIGLIAAMKAFRPTTIGIMVQTPRWGAFVKSFNSGKMEYNDSSLSPYTVTVVDKGVKKPVIYEDGISVDAPESMEAICMARKYLDFGVYADANRALNKLAPILLKDLDSYYDNDKEAIVGGTTAIVADALLYNCMDMIQCADVIVLFATEGSIDPAIAVHTRHLLRAGR